MSTSDGVANLTREQLAASLKRVDSANDMLPPREDDKVAGRIASRFVEGLHARTSTQSYQCARADIVPVPKRLLTTRPAAVLSLKDRVVFEALVELARPKITAYLVSNASLVWPRADDTRPAWDEFERGPIVMGGGYVVSADVAGFYESIDHRYLGMVLADAGVDVRTREAISAQLGELMGAGRGLPQGVQTSDSLATLYLAPVDSAVQRAGLTFWRHGDDFRIWSPTYPEALAAVFELEQALRARGLLLSVGKLAVEALSGYAGRLDDLDRASAQFRERIKVAREMALVEASEEELERAVREAGLDEDMQWRFFYHHTMEFPELLEALAPSLTPKPIEVVVEMLNDLMSRTPKEQLPAQLAHARLTFCIRRLARAKSVAALPWVAELLVKRPDEVQDLANYMLAVIGLEPQKVIAACQYALTNKAHLLDWERAWIYRVLSRRADLVHASIIDDARGVAVSDAAKWLARVEACRLLARADRLTQDIANQVSRNAPECYAGDIAGIIAMVEEPGTWTSRYLDGARQDALQAVVIDAVRANVNATRR